MFSPNHERDRGPGRRIRPERLFFTAVAVLLGVAATRLATSGESSFRESATPTPAAVATMTPGGPSPEALRFSIFNTQGTTAESTLTAPTSANLTATPLVK